MKRRLLITGFAGLLSVLGGSFTTVSVAAEALTFKMQFASPDGTSWNKMDRRFAAQIEDLTGRRAKVQFFPPNSVTPFKDWLQATGGGLLDIGFVWHPILQGKFLQMELFGLPGLSKNQTVASVVYFRMREKYPALAQLFTPQDNVVELATFVAMGSHLHTRKPVRTLADLKGMVFGAQDAAGVRVLKELGAGASVMVGSDAYLALQRGAIDGVLAAWGWVNNFKLNEVTTYHTLMNLNPGSYSSVMNKDTYTKLTAEEKKRLAELMPLYFFYNTTDSAAAATAQIPPANIFNLSSADQSALAEKMKPQWNEWVAKADKKGWPGQQMLDEAVRLMRLYDQN